MARLLNLPSHADARGRLTVAEPPLPFAPKRVFWITGAGGQQRGGHRHKLTEMLLVAVQGTIVVAVQSPHERREYPLTSPDQALYLAPEDWHALHFSDTGVLLVIASLPYDATDYILEPYANQP